MAPPPYVLIHATSDRRPRYGLLVVGALALAGAGAAAVFMLRPQGTPSEAAVAEAITPTVVVAQQMAGEARTGMSPPARSAETLPSVPPTRSVETVPLLARSAAVCATCGTVEAVRPASRPVEASGGKAGGAFEVQVRMDDGTLRGFTSSTQPQPGAAVRVQGDGFRVMQPPS